MKHISTSAFWILGLTAIYLNPDIRAQAPSPAAPVARVPVMIRNVEAQPVGTPVFEVKGPSQQPARGKWLHVFAEYDTEPEWIDELTFTVYVGFKGRTKEAPPLSVFKGEVTQVHIAAGKRHIVDMYVHPRLIERYGEPGPVAIEVKQKDGRVLGTSGKPEPTQPWWNNPQYTIVSDGLLNRSQTPFALIDIESQELIKSK